MDDVYPIQHKHFLITSPGSQRAKSHHHGGSTSTSCLDTWLNIHETHTQIPSVVSLLGRLPRKQLDTGLSRRRNLKSCFGLSSDLLISHQAQIWLQIYPKQMLDPAKHYIAEISAFYLQVWTHSKFTDVSKICVRRAKAVKTQLLCKNFSPPISVRIYRRPVQWLLFSLLWALSVCVWDFFRCSQHNASCDGSRVAGNCAMEVFLKCVSMV